MTGVQVTNLRRFLNYFYGEEVDHKTFCAIVQTVRAAYVYEDGVVKITYKSNSGDYWFRTWNSFGDTWREPISLTTGLCPYDHAEEAIKL
jgi:hypothetical protein